jgi:hypothetical protein
VVIFSDPYSGINSYNLLAQSIQERTEDGKKYYDLYTVSHLPTSIMKEDGLPLLMKIITITSNSVVFIDGLEGVDRKLEPDITFQNKGDGSKFLSNNGLYEEIPLNIQNNLEQEDEGAVLDARQGLVLKKMIEGLSARIQELENQKSIILEK